MGFFGYSFQTKRHPIPVFSLCQRTPSCCPGLTWKLSINRSSLTERKPYQWPSFQPMWLLLTHNEENFNLSNISPSSLSQITLFFLRIPTGYWDLCDICLHNQGSTEKEAPFFKLYGAQSAPCSPQPWFSLNLANSPRSVPGNFDQWHRRSMESWPENSCQISKISSFKP